MSVWYICLWCAFPSCRWVPFFLGRISYTGRGAPFFPSPLLCSLFSDLAAMCIYLRCVSECVWLYVCLPQAPPCYWSSATWGWWCKSATFRQVGLSWFMHVTVKTIVGLFPSKASSRLISTLRFQFPLFFFVDMLLETSDERNNERELKPSKFVNSATPLKNKS